MVWYQELGDKQMNTVKQKKAWDEETTFSYVKTQLKRRKLDCECANVRKPFPLPTKTLYLCCFSAPAGAELHLYHFQELIELRVPGEGGEVPFPLWAGQEGAQVPPLLLRSKCPNHSIKEETSQPTQLHCTVPESHIPESDWSLRAPLKKLLQSLKLSPAHAGAECQPWVRDLWAWRVTLY